MMSLASAALCLLLAAGQEPAKRPSYRLPYEEGKSYPLTQGNGGATSHTGYCQYAFDFGMAEGTKVCAARDGKVVFAGDEETRSGRDGKYGSSGNHIKVDHGDGTVGLYLHLKHEGALVEIGDLVLQGDVIGLSGSTGNVTGPHLHFQVDKGGKSIPIAFDDVETDGGIPLAGRSYPSRNTPGIPAETKEKLGALSRAAKLAHDQGAWGVAYLAFKRLAEEKLRVKYPPQDEARRKMDEIASRASEIARLKDAAALFEAKAAFEGAPAGPIAEALESLRQEPGYAEARARAWYWDHFYRGVKDEVEGRLPSARTHYRNIVTNKPDPQLAARTQARLDAVDGRLKELRKKAGP